MRLVEISSLAQLRTWLVEGRPLTGLRLQDLDLGPVEPQLLRRADVDGLVVLGGHVSRTLVAHLQAHGAVVFARNDTAPVDVFRAHLYTGPELYAGLSGPGGYADTVDSRAYAWSRDARLSRDAYATLLRAIHDDSMSDALSEWVEGRQVVGVMGGHAADRGTAGYAASAHLGRDLAAAGFLVATGGGPGAMEAANLGAVAPSSSALTAALVTLAQVPSFRPDVGAWARVAFQVLESFGPAGTPRPRSLGIPTWFYGHEPPNVFAEGIAKYFSNAVREDGLLTRCNAGVVVLPGAAGTVQEIFQLATRLYYAPEEAAPPPLVLVGRHHWTTVLPTAQLLGALGAGRAMGDALHLVDTIEAAIALVCGEHRPLGSAGS
ncbi:LOG family protein [Lapillicoccus sp.]|uniref:LOG family protein n=1 Tax=Lapillicoccus sp. TaxID=1909287 RepID=UPI003983723A